MMSDHVWYDDEDGYEEKKQQLPMRIVSSSTPPSSPPSTIRLSRRATQGSINYPVEIASFVCGLTAGVAQAGIFNPYDRALYLSVKEVRPFLAWSNWKNPYTGFWQSIGHRALSGGLYFPLEHYFLRCLDKEGSNSHYNFIAGTAAGAVNATLLNPLSAIKYKTWGREENPGMWAEAFGMLRKSGSIRPFLNGLKPTIYRDVVFGGCYTGLRLQIQASYNLEPSQQWMGNMVAAGIATVASGPFNYVRNIQYGTSSAKKADSTWKILADLWYQTRYECHTVAEQLAFLQSRLRIGWGTARVAMGMAFAHAVYDFLHELYTKLYESNPSSPPFSR